MSQRKLPRSFVFQYLPNLQHIKKMNLKESILEVYYYEIQYCIFVVGLHICLKIGSRLLIFSKRDVMYYQHYFTN